MEDDFSDPLSYEERFVVFFDVLGWKSHIKNAGDDPDKIGKLASLPRMMKHMEGINSGGLDNPDKSQLTSFSDCCVLSRIYDETHLPNLIYGLCRVFIGVALQGFLLRAGVTIGKLYHDKNLVFGPALNRAYFLESNTRYPRIRLDTEIESIKALNLIPNMISTDEKYGTFIDPYQFDFIKSEYCPNPIPKQEFMGIETDTDIELFTHLLQSLELILTKTRNDKCSTEEIIDQVNWPYLRVRQQLKRILNP
ncbi:hypothetical protein [Methylophaga thalassica]|uniref:hypothetical protein n=1 Tax=Methylophaga thalassica TaxID=40223 RepID=UPI002E7B92BC|nr:hypothetical protein [Methylophaga thalassica]WVI83835.1 hypothetical protein VSX76_00355 [Methylophaga thalassica]